MKKQLFIILLVFTAISVSSAQDVIYKKNKEEIKAKVTEIGIDEIKYKLFDLQDGPDFVMLKTDVWKIKYSNGQETIFQKDEYDVAQDVEIRHKTHSIKFEFFSPLTDDIAFGYEQMIKVGMNVEGKIGIIGIGTNPNAPDASGVFVKTGIKFKKHSDVIIRGMKYAHALSGAYIKPEIIFSHFVRKNYPTSYTTQITNPYYPYNTYTGTAYKPQDIKVTHIAAEIIFGKQLFQKVRIQLQNLTMKFKQSTISLLTFKQEI